MKGKRQFNPIFFLVLTYVMMHHPKTIKEDGHDKTKQRGLPIPKPATLEGAFNRSEKKRSEPCLVLQTAPAFLSRIDLLEQKIFQAQW